MPHARAVGLILLRLLPIFHNVTAVLGERLATCQEHLATQIVWNANQGTTVTRKEQQFVKSVLMAKQMREEGLKRAFFAQLESA